MKTPSAELKRIARENLNGKYGIAILVMITASLFRLLCSILLQRTPVMAVHHKGLFIIWLLLLLL